MLDHHPLGLRLLVRALSALLAVAPAPCLAEQTSPPLEELIRIEHAAWTAWRDHDGDHYRRLLLPDHVAVNGHGVARREEVAKAIEDPACRVEGFSLGEFELRRPAPDVALLLFRAGQDAACGGMPEPPELRATSLYVRGEDGWRSLFHQSTPLLAVEQPEGSLTHTGEVLSMDARISIITLGVADLERSIAFYRDGLGLPQREGPPGIAFFTTRGTWLSLYAREKLAEDAQVDPAGSGFRGFTLAHNVKSRDEVDHLIGKARDAGGRILKEPQEASWGGYSGYFEDPDGFLWEVAWNPHFTVD